MRTAITLIVEHDETTDDVQEFVETVSRPDHDLEKQWLECFGFDFKVTDYSVKVDI